MATAKQIMEKALSYVGVKESPKNSNNVIFNTDYYGKQVSGSAYPWCCAYVWDIFRMCGASKLFYYGNKTAYCPSVDSWGKSQGLTVSKNQGRYGDIVLFSWHKKNAQHIGFIVGQNTDGTYQTVEGNTSLGNNSNGGEVMIRTRKQSEIWSIIRPKYEGTSDVPSATKKDDELTTFIKDVQRNIGVNPDGIVGKITRSALPTLSKKINRKHGVVKVVQARLIKLGYSCGKCGADGDYGSGTASAVISYQKAKGLCADGVIGINTWNTLLK